MNVNEKMQTCLEIASACFRMYDEAELKRLHAVLTERQKLKAKALFTQNQGSGETYQRTISQLDDNTTQLKSCIEQVAPKTGTVAWLD
jgi:hypothetical protein